MDTANNSPISSATLGGRALAGGRWLGWGLILFTLCAGVTRPPQQHPKPHNDSGWLDVRSVFTFNLPSDTPPQSSGALADAIAAGQRDTFICPPGATIVKAEGGNFPNVQNLTIDLTEAKGDINKKGAKINSDFPPKPGPSAQQLTVSCQPMYLGSSQVNYQMEVTGAHFQFCRDEAGHPVLLLTDAKQGSINVAVSNQDLQGLAGLMAKDVGKKSPTSLGNVQIQLGADSPRRLNVRVRVIVLGGSLHLKAQIDVDDQMYGTLSNLSCSGDGIWGTVLATIVTPFLHPYEGQRKPLLQFPSDRIKLRDVQFKVDDSIHLMAAFGAADDSAGGGGKNAN